MGHPSLRTGHRRRRPAAAAAVAVARSSEGARCRRRPGPGPIATVGPGRRGGGPRRGVAPDALDQEPPRPGSSGWATDAEYQVEHRGESAVRGGIVDADPSTWHLPVRIPPLGGDEAYRLTEFDPGDQRSVADLETIELRVSRGPATAVRVLRLLRSWAASRGDGRSGSGSQRDRSSTGWSS